MGQQGAQPGCKAMAILLSKTDADPLAFSLMYTQGQNLKLHGSRNEKMREREDRERFHWDWRKGRSSQVKATGHCWAQEISTQVGGAPVPLTNSRAFKVCIPSLLQEEVNAVTKAPFSFLPSLCSLLACSENLYSKDIKRMWESKIFKIQRTELYIYFWYYNRHFCKDRGAMALKARM